MSIRVRAVYSNGILTPLEPTGLEQGCEVTLEISDPHPPSEEAATEQEQPEGEPTLSGLLALVDDLHRKYPPEMWGDHPPDFVKNKKHYLYGHPKEAD